MDSILNIAAYRFVPLHNLQAWQANLLQAAQGLGLKGTVLLAEEGINLFLAGPQSDVRQWLQHLQS
ncbi:MAG: sulfurtransferase, partial [Betaproteobacteria bacterium]